jgi:hypothetical protein
MALPRYQVTLEDQSGSIGQAELTEATQDDMPSLKRGECEFYWESFWEKADFQYQAIVKLTLNGKCLGLVHFSAFNDSVEDIEELKNKSPEYIFIDYLERIDKQTSYKPVGLWLIWYVVNMALSLCTGDCHETLILLHSLSEAIPYYEKQVMMEGMNWVTLAPGEEGYAFRFTKQGAKQFCDRIQQRYSPAKFFE